MIYVLAAAATVLASECAFRLPLGRVASYWISTAGKSVAVIRSPRISEHWKARAVLAYSVSLLVTTLELALMFASVLGVVAVAWLAGHLFGRDLLHFLVSWQGLGAVTGVSSVYLVARRRLA